MHDNQKVFYPYSKNKKKQSFLLKKCFVAGNVRFEDVLI